MPVEDTNLYSIKRSINWSFVGFSMTMLSSIYEFKTIVVF